MLYTSSSENTRIGSRKISTRNLYLGAIHFQVSGKMRGGGEEMTELLTEGELARNGDVTEKEEE